MHIYKNKTFSLCKGMQCQLHMCSYVTKTMHRLSPVRLMNCSLTPLNKKVIDSFSLNSAECPFALTLLVADMVITN